ncbi:hypothetical protein ACQEVZ_57475 [Dactylosporangium sp. CA-152071]|uniref:hypothetical protein n=1 Tax=Dactylosporangium sp. CA-152071 TaxID=3239933 RepID=UPI003D8F0D3B
MRRGLVIAAVVLTLVLGWGTFASTQPPGRHEFRATAVEAAQSAHDALESAYAAGTELRQGRVTTLYVTVLLDGGTRRTATRIDKLAHLPPPDDDMRALRDELAPMLTESMRRLGDTAAEPTEVGALPALTERLSVFLEQYG